MDFKDDDPLTLKPDLEIDLEALPAGARMMLEILKRCPKITKKNLFIISTQLLAEYQGDEEAALRALLAGDVLVHNVKDQIPDGYHEAPEID